MISTHLKTFNNLNRLIVLLPQAPSIPVNLLPVLDQVGRVPRLVTALVANVPLVRVEHHVRPVVAVRVRDLLALGADKLLHAGQLLAVLLEHVREEELLLGKLLAAVGADVDGLLPRFEVADLVGRGEVQLEAVGLPEGLGAVGTLVRLGRLARRRVGVLHVAVVTDVRNLHAAEGTHLLTNQENRIE